MDMYIERINDERLSHKKQQEKRKTKEKLEKRNQEDNEYQKFK